MNDECMACKTQDDGDKLVKVGVRERPSINDLLFTVLQFPSQNEFKRENLLFQTQYFCCDFTHVLLLLNKNEEKNSCIRTSLCNGNENENRK